MSTALVEITVPEGIPADEFDAFVRREGEDDNAWTHVASSRSAKFEITVPSTGSLEIGLGWRLNGVLVSPDLWTVVPYKASDASDFDVPDDVTSFGAGQEGGTIRFTWRAVEVENLSHYEIRRLPLSAVWDDGIWIADVPAPATSFVVGWWASGSQTHAIKAVTTQGVKSATQATATLIVRDDDYFVQHTTTSEQTTFSGTKAGTEVDTNLLRPTTHPASYADKSEAYEDYTDPWWFPTSRYGSYTTSWIDAGALMDEKVEIVLGYTTTDLVTSYETRLYPHNPEFDDVTQNAIGPGERRPGDFGTYSGKPVDGIRIRVEIDTSQDGGPTPEGFRDWVPGTVYRFHQYRLRFTFLNDWPFVRPAVSTMTHRIKRRNLKDEQSVVVSGTGGTTVNWTTLFQVAPKVTATVVTNASRHVTVDTITTTGCKVYVWDAAGSEQSSGTVHVIATGV